MRYYYTESTLKLPVRFDYDCPYCNSHNSYIEEFTVSERTQGKELSSSQKTAVQNLLYQRLFSRMVRIEKRDFKGTDFNARCEKCDKSPAWANYPRKILPTVMLILGLLTLFAPLFFYTEQKVPRPFFILFPIALILLFFSFPFYSIRCKKRDKEISQLRKENFPRISKE